MSWGDSRGRLSLHRGGRLSFGIRQTRLPDQAQPKQHSESRIKGQAKTGPPAWHSRVVDEEVMDEIKDSVPDQANRENPQISLEPQYRK